MILNEDFFDGMDDGQLSSDLEELIPDIEIATEDKSMSPDAYKHKLMFQMNGIRRSKIYETNVQRISTVYKYLKMLIDKCPFVTDSSDLYIVFGNYWDDREKVQPINDFRGMLIQCDPKFLKPECTIIRGTDTYKADTVFNSSSLTFCIGVNTSELDTVRKAD